MTSENKKIWSCANRCWVVGGLLGFAVMLMLSGLLGLNIFIALVVGLAVMVGLALAIQKYFCIERPPTIVRPGPSQGKAQHETYDVAASPAAVAQADHVGQSDLATTPHMPDHPRGVTSADLEEPLDNPDPRPEYEPQPDPEPTPEPEPMPSPAEPTPAPEPTGVPVPEPSTIPNPEDSAVEPERLSAPMAGGPDDLKQLKGVGPKLEQTLHELGFFHFDQIARWTEEEIAWVDSKLSFKGRIQREGWVEQARALTQEKAAQP